VPGSHQVALPADAGLVDDHPLLERSVQLMVGAGDALLFPWSLWHSVVANLSTQTRLSAVVWYSQLWIRPFDHHRVDPGVLARLTPRQRLLFGDLADTTDPQEYYWPTQPDYLDTMIEPPWRRSREMFAYLRAVETFRQ